MLDLQVTFLSEILQFLFVFNVYSGQFVQFLLQLPLYLILLHTLIFLNEIIDHLIKTLTLLFQLRLVIFLILILWYDTLLVFDHLTHTVNKLFITRLT
jgi:succinate dehydrogenase hydrophobic anchor subunit